jgi:hypothetical protein
MFRKLIYLIFCFLLFTGSAFGAAKIRGFDHLTGGDDGALDNLDPVAKGINDNDISIGIDAANEIFAVYRFEASCSESENSPYYIVPDVNGSGKCWILQSFRTGTGAADVEGSLQLFEDPDNGGNYIGWKASASHADNLLFEITDTSPVDSFMQFGTPGAGVSAATFIDGDTMREGGAVIYLGDGGANAITAGTKYYAVIPVPYNCDLKSVKLLTPETSGNITIDLWVDSFANWPPTNADSLFDSASEPTISDASSDNEVEVTSFDGGEADFAKGDIIILNVDSITTLKEVNVFLEWEKE